MKMKKLLLSVSISACAILSGAASADHHAINSALQGKHRTESYVARDEYRNPDKIIEFFGIQPHHTVLEVWPSRGYWAEIFAPYLKSKGTYIAAQYDVNDTQASYRPTVRKEFDKKIADNKVYSKVVTTSLVMDKQTKALTTASAKPNSVDRVVTFRSVHGWYRAGLVDTAFAHFFDVLKPGGKLGLVQHMADENQDWRSKNIAYVGREYVISAALQAGFVLEAEAFFNRNPLDTKRHENGVWQLLPTLRGSDTQEQKETYKRIGESERMTLLFVKPKS